MIGLLRQLTPRQYLLIGLALGALIVVMVFYNHIDVAAINAKAAELNGLAVFAGIVVLPLAGFPVTVTHAVAGVRFGIGWGFVLVALATLCQLLASYGLVKLAPGFFARRLEPLRRRLPKGAHTSLTLFTMLLPGAPYFAQIYVLPLVGVPLGTFLLLSLPLNVARCIVGVTFGDMSAHLTPGRLAGFAAYAIGITLACAWAFQRLQRKMKDQPAEADGPRPPASGHSAGRKRAGSRSGRKRRGGRDA